MMATIFKNLTSREFQSEINGNTTAELIDVRTPGEYRSGKIPGAINIDIMDEKFLRAIQRLDKSKTYYVYCRSGGRSANACHLMAQQGFNVANLAGGISGWQGDIVE
jgi:rhodanese-related sulfurtransferase